MDLSQLETLVPIAGIIISVGTAIITVQKIFKNFKRDREEMVAKILQEAKEEVALLKSRLDRQLDTIKAELDLIELNTSKDVEQIQYVHGTEMKVLAGKIEDLRTDIRDQHVQILGIVNRLIDKK